MKTEGSYTGIVNCSPREGSDVCQSLEKPILHPYSPIHAILAKRSKQGLSKRDELKYSTELGSSGFR